MTTNSTNLHSLTSQGIAEFAGVGIHRLAEQVGRTPFFAYDRTAIAARIATIKSTLPERLQLSYAVKANPMPALVGHVRPLVDGFDVASKNEMRVALDAGMPPTRSASPARERPTRSCRAQSPPGSRSRSNPPPRHSVS